MLTIVSFLLVLSILVFVHEFGHLIVAKWRGVKVEEFGLGYPPRLFTIMKLGETSYTVNAIPFGGFARMAGEDDPNEARGLSQQPKLSRVAIMAAGPVMNLLLAVLCFSLSFGLISATGNGVRITEVREGWPAAAAGLRSGDVILKADSTKLQSPSSLISYTESRADQVIILTVRRGGSAIEIPVTPRYNEDSRKGEMGVYLAPKLTWGQAFVQGGMQTVAVVWLTLTIPALLIRGSVPLEAARPIGPVGIAQLTGGAVEQSLAVGWWFPILQLVGLLSAALAITNLLPLPALDGGRIFFVIVEAIRGKRISPEKEGLIHLVGFFLLISLLVVITYADITSPLPPIDWGSVF